IPENISTAGEKDVTWKSLEARISPQHRDFTRNLLKKYGVELTTTNVADNQPQPVDAQRARVARRLFPPSDQADCECARRAAEADDRHGPQAWRAGRSPRRFEGARAAAGRRRWRHPCRAGAPGRGAFRRGT